MLFATSSTIATPPSSQCSTHCVVRGDEPVRIAVCFFGMPRSLAFTLPSLQANLLTPLKKAGAVDVFVHALAGVAQNSHADEEGLQDERHIRSCTADVLAFAPCRFAVQEQAIVDQEQQLVPKAANTLHRSKLLYREYYDVPTLLNVYRSRYSLSQAAKLVRAHQEAQGFEYTHVVAARSDAAMLAPLDWRPLAAGVTIPNFEHGGAQFVVTQPSGATETLTIGGVNDRFAYGDVRSMLQAYMAQYEEQLSSADGVQMTTSETLLCNQLVRHDVAVALSPLCIVRVRATGQLATYMGQDDLTYPPRARPGGCRGLRFMPNSTDGLNGCAGLSWPSRPQSKSRPQNFRCVSMSCHQVQERLTADAGHRDGRAAALVLGSGAWDATQRIRERYELAQRTPSDINEHLATLRMYASRVGSIAEMGVRGVVSTWAFLLGLTDSEAPTKIMIGIDLKVCDYEPAIALGEQAGVQLQFLQGDSASVDIPPRDLLFIDTWHVYAHLKRELRAHHASTRRYIVLHDVRRSGAQTWSASSGGKRLISV